MFLKTKPSLGLTVKNNGTVCKSKLKIVQCYEARKPTYEVELQCTIKRSERLETNIFEDPSCLCIACVTCTHFKHNIKHKKSSNVTKTNKKKKSLEWLQTWCLLKETSSKNLYVVRTPLPGILERVQSLIFENRVSGFYYFMLGFKKYD